MARKHDKSKSPKHSKPRPIARAAPVHPSPDQFDEVLGLIEAARARAFTAINKELIDLYWNIGEHISRRIAADGWGQGTVEALADYIRKRRPGMSGFSARNLWRMMQFYETYRDQPKLSALLTRIDLDPQPADPGQVQAGRRTRVLPPTGTRPEMAEPGTGTADKRCSVRADSPVPAKTVSTADRIASRRRRGLQGHLSGRVPRPARRTTPRPTCSAAWSSN